FWTCESRCSGDKGSSSLNSNICSIGRIFSGMSNFFNFTHLAHPCRRRHINDGVGEFQRFPPGARENFPSRLLSDKAWSFRAERGMERMGRATWTAQRRGSRERVGRRTSSISQSKLTSHKSCSVINELLGDPSPATAGSG